MIHQPTDEDVTLTIAVPEDSPIQLSQLERWLAEDIALGGIQMGVSNKEGSPEEMGLDAVLSIVLGSGALIALIKSLFLYIEARGAVRITVSNSDGRIVQIDMNSALKDEAAHLARKLLGQDV